MYNLKGKRKCQLEQYSIILRERGEIVYFICIQIIHVIKKLHRKFISLIYFVNDSKEIS